MLSDGAVLLVLCFSFLEKPAKMSLNVWYLKGIQHCFYFMSCQVKDSFYDLLEVSNLFFQNWWAELRLYSSNAHSCCQKHLWVFCWLVYFLLFCLVFIFILRELSSINIETFPSWQQWLSEWPMPMLCPCWLSRCRKLKEFNIVLIKRQNLIDQSFKILCWHICV